MREAVQLEPPTDSQISAYLDHLESTGAPVADIRAALAADPDLKELLRSPLMLNVIRFGYYARTKSSHTPTAAEQWPARLWDAYITGIFTQYPLPKKGYRLDQAITWLAWLAKATREHGLIEFRPGILTEYWLPVTHDKPLNTLQRSLKTASTERPLPLLGLQRTWGRRVLRRRLATNIALAGSLLAGLATSALVLQLLHGSWTSRGLQGASTVTWLFLLCVAISAGTTEHVTISPEGIGRTDLVSRVYRPWQGLVGGIVTGFLGTLTGGFYLGLAAAISMLFFFEPIMINAEAVVFLARDFMRPYAARILLARLGIAPMRFKAFLDEMTHRQLLRHTNNGYFFAHYLLRDHLAEDASVGLRSLASSVPNR